MTIETQSRPFDNRDKCKKVSFSNHVALKSKAAKGQPNPETNHNTEQSDTINHSIFIFPMIFVVLDFFFCFLFCFLPGFFLVVFLPIILREEDVEPSLPPSISGLL